MSFELEIFPTICDQLRSKDIVDLLNTRAYSKGVHVHQEYEIEFVNKDGKPTYNEELLIDNDYEIKLDSNSVLFFSIIENDDVFNELDVLKGFNEKKIANETLIEISVLWKKIGFSFGLESKHINSDDLRLFLIFSIELAEKTNGLLCVKQNLDRLEGGLYYPNDFKEKLIKENYI